MTAIEPGVPTLPCPECASGLEAGANGKPTVEDTFDELWIEIRRIRKAAGLPKLIKGKPACLKQWKKLGKRRPTIDTVVAYFEAGSRSRDWTKDDGEYCPHASSIFNGERWEDGLDSFTAPRSGNGSGRPYRRTELEERMMAVAEGHDDEELDIPARLANLAAVLPDNLVDRDNLIERICTLEGSAEEIEQSLAALDREVVRRATDNLDNSQAIEVGREVVSSNVALARRLPADRLKAAEERLRDDAVRRLIGLPVLSLFSVEAASSTEEDIPF